ncbi:hypothetical protein C8R45DRAFT_1015871 [Mycena sanguinolenta]|nr:hypothetical protein C8R45DRAFT_1015871 [Mycena sanguinolenta]
MLASYRPKGPDDDKKKTGYVRCGSTMWRHYDGYCKQISSTTSSGRTSPLDPSPAPHPPHPPLTKPTPRQYRLQQPSTAPQAASRRVHDYHLLVPKLRVPEAVIGLFVHTPFSSTVLRCLPRRKEILDRIVGLTCCASRPTSIIGKVVLIQVTSPFLTDSPKLQG